MQDSARERSESTTGRLLPISLIAVAVIVIAVGAIRLSRSTVGGDASASVQGQLPNVLLITADTTRADFLSCYGRADAPTPYIERLAAEGTVYERCYSCSSLTAPSHTSILTGVYPFVHGVRTNGPHRLWGNFETLAERLKEDGYKTHAIVASSVLDRKHGLDQGFDRYEEVPRGAIGDNVIAELKGDKIRERAIAAIDELADDRFFLWVHFYDPHNPYETDRPNATTRQAYADEVAFMDAQIGAILQRLEDGGLTDKTLVVLVADHGEGLGDHDETWHGYFVWDTTLHVPLLFRMPGRVQAGKRVSAVVRTVDIAPTILDTIGIERDDSMQGFSLKAANSSDDSVPGRPAYAESMEPYYHFGLSPQRCLVDWPWKFVLSEESALYNLADDPAETLNLAGQYAGRAEEMRRSIESAIEEAPSPPSEEARSTIMTGQDLDMLRTLGYSGETRGEGLSEFELLDAGDGEPRSYSKTIDAYCRARWANSQGNPEQAEALLREVVEALPDAAHMISELAWTIDAQGRPAEAEQLYKLAISKEERDSFTRRLYAGLLLKHQRYAEAIEHFQVALEESPADLESLRGVGVAQCMLGEFELSQKHLEAALALGADNAITLHALGVLFARQHKYDQAKTYFKKTLQVQPRHAGARRDLTKIEKLQNGGGR